MSTNYRQLLAEAQRLFKRGDWNAAEKFYREVLALRPRDTDALQGMGLICTQAKRYTEAADFFGQAVALKPYATDALGNLGAVLAAADRHQEAIAAFQQFLALKPDHASTHYNLGISYKLNGQFAEAVGAYRRAIELKPDYAAAFFNMGNALRALRKPEEAIAAFHEALRLDPQHAEACNNLGHTLKERFQFEEAITCFRRAMTIRPGFSDSLAALAGTLQTMGQVEEAAELYRHHVRLHPDDHLAHAGLAFALAQLPDQQPEAAYEEHKRWGIRHAADQAHSNAAAAWSQAHDRSPQRVLRIGYVSPDFREHSVAFFLENLIAFHHPDKVQVFCYSNVTDPDAVTARFRAHAHYWRDVFTLSDEALADLIRKEDIDILVDLAGHTSGNRLKTFAKRRTIQVAYLGYVDTTGMTQMDYRLVDAQTDPPGLTDAIHTERLIRLPRTFACYRPPENAPPVESLPALANGYVTFACLSGAGKLHDALLLSWAEIMARVPGSRILFAATGFASPTVQARMLTTLASAGVAPDRVEFQGLQKLDAYLPLHHRIDILLDPFPINGHTITCHALWMGVPVVSRAGVKYVSRLGASVLFNLGLTELLAGSAEEYVEIAAKLANDLPRLAELRSGMRDRMIASPLMDYPAFAADVEAAYRAMWIRWCA